MNPPKAIKNLKHTYDFLQSVLSTEDLEAIHLGIEALEFRLRWEQQEGQHDFPLLPGETKD